MKKLTCLFLAVLLTIALAVPTMANEQNVRIILAVEYERTEEFYNLHTADWRVYVDGNFADLMSIQPGTRWALASLVLMNAASTTMPVVELVIVGYDITIVFDLELETDVWGQFWDSAVQLEEVLAAMPAQAPAQPAATPITDSRVLRFPIGSTTFTDAGASRTLEAAPFIANDRTMVPLRVIVEALGATDLNMDSGVVSFNLDGQNFSMTIDQELPGGMGTPVIVAGRTFVPLAFIATNVGANVRWDREARAAYVYLS